MKRVTRKLSYANVVATLALVIAVAGGTTAVAGPGKAPKNSVNSKSIKDGSVTARDLAKIRVVSAATGVRCPGKTKLLGGGTGAPDPGLKNTWFNFEGQGAQAVALCLAAKPGK